MGPLRHDLAQFIVADLTGQNQKRQLRLAALYHSESPGGTKIGDIVFGKHNIPLPARQRRLQGGGSIHPMALEQIAAVPQHIHCLVGIICRTVNDEESEIFFTALCFGHS